MDRVNDSRSNASRAIAALWPWLVFALAFALGPLLRMKQLSLMPGSGGDERLNNYFLENIYQFLVGNSPSLWHLQFYAPFTYIGGFSDNLFGASPIYLLFRWLTGEYDTAFQLWYLASFAANYAATYCALRMLGRSRMGSSIGALVFAFALPVTAKQNHAQLAYRFGAPLALAEFALFATHGDWRRFVRGSAWLTWQFFCTIYIGFFTLVLTVLMLAFAIIREAVKGPGSLGAALKTRVAGFRDQSRRVRLLQCGSMIAMGGALVLLFYPYAKASSMYGITRTYEQIEAMLPRPSSYLLADGSYLWSWLGKAVDISVLRWEHQLFVGLVPLVLGILGYVWGRKRLHDGMVQLMAASLVGTVLLTLHVGVSAWQLVAPLPLASAIRAVSRIELVLLFPLGYLGAVAIDQLPARLSSESLARGVALLVAVVAIAEFSLVVAPMTPKEQGRQGVARVEAFLPPDLPSDAIVFVKVGSEPGQVNDLDVMLATLFRGVATMNGYTGSTPPGCLNQYGGDPLEASRRIQSFLGATGRLDDAGEYEAIKRRVVLFDPKQ